MYAPSGPESEVAAVRAEGFKSTSVIPAAPASKSAFAPARPRPDAPPVRSAVLPSIRKAEVVALEDVIGLMFGRL